MTTTMTDIQQPDYRKHRQRLELTPEEAKAWQACMRSSNIMIPTLIGATVGYGFFRLTPFHAQAKYAALVSGMIGLISSRITMSQICLTKVASMPNSTLKDRLIEAGYYGNNRPMSERQYQGFQPLDMQSEIQNLEEPSTDIVFDDYPPMNTYDMYSSINDSSDFRTTEDTDLTEPINLQKGISYDELRNKNREEFYKKNKQWYTPRVGDRHQANNTTEQYNRTVPITSNTPLIQEKTKYEDVWD